MKQQPNILLIVSDQFRGDCLSSAGHPAILTPNLDGLCSEGASFRRAYATCPSCVPSRRALMTGLHPMNNGLVGMSHGYPITTPTLPDQLRREGYQTALIGRTMHQSPPTARYGYEEMSLISGLRDELQGQEVGWESGGRGAVRSLGLSFNGWTARPWDQEENLHPTNAVTRASRRFIQSSDETCPLFLTASYNAPHPPLYPPPFYFERYLRMELPSPAIGQWATPPDTLPTVDSNRVHLKGEALRSVQAGYFGMINHLDDQLYWLIADFRAMSRARGREWVIAFASDHGEMLGDHYQFRKCEPYEGSARVPLIIAGSPGLGFQSGANPSTPVCWEDLFPTFVELAGGTFDGTLDGRSLVSLLRGGTDRVRDLLHGEHARQYDREQAYHFLTDGRWKYIWRSITGREQLFDLETDPQELEDRSVSASGITDRFREELISRLAHRPEGFVREGALHPVENTIHYLL